MFSTDMSQVTTINVPALRRSMSNEQNGVVSAYHKTELAAGLAQVKVQASSAGLENAKACGIALRIGRGSLRLQTIPGGLK